MASVKVFGSPTSAEVARVLMCLFEKEVEFQLIRVDAYRGTKRMPQYLKLQPHGEALTFEDGNVTLVGTYTRNKRCDSQPTNCKKFRIWSSNN